MTSLISFIVRLTISIFAWSVFLSIRGIISWSRTRIFSWLRRNCLVRYLVLIRIVRHCRDMRRTIHMWSRNCWGVIKKVRMSWIGFLMGLRLSWLMSIIEVRRNLLSFWKKRLRNWRNRKNNLLLIWSTTRKREPELSSSFKKYRRIRKQTRS